MKGEGVVTEREEYCVFFEHAHTQNALRTTCWCIAHRNWGSLVGNLHVLCEIFLPRNAQFHLGTPLL